MTNVDETAQVTLDEEEVRCSVEEVLDALAETMPVLLESAPSADTTSTLQGTIAIVGEEPATLTVRADMATCRKFAVGWSLAGPGEPSNDDAIDAMSEFVNIIGGSVKAVFAAESSLGIPVVEVIDAEAGSNPADLLTVEHPIGRIEVGLEPQ